MRWHLWCHWNSSIINLPFGPLNINPNTVNPCVLSCQATVFETLRVERIMVKKKLLILWDYKTTRTNMYVVRNARSAFSRLGTLWNYLSFLLNQSINQWITEQRISRTTHLPLKIKRLDAVAEIVLVVVPNVVGLALYQNHLLK